MIGMCFDGTVDSVRDVVLLREVQYARRRR